MKKLTLFAAAVLALGLFASCSDEVQDVSVTNTANTQNRYWYSASGTLVREEYTYSDLDGTAGTKAVITENFSSNRALAYIQWNYDNTTDSYVTGNSNVAIYKINISRSESVRKNYASLTATTPSGTTTTVDGSRTLSVFRFSDGKYYANGFSVKPSDSNPTPSPAIGSDFTNIDINPTADTVTIQFTEKRVFWYDSDASRNVATKPENGSKREYTYTWNVTLKKGVTAVQAPTATSGSGSGTGDSYLPAEFAGETVSALFIAPISSSSTNGNSAVYFFSDKTFVITYSLVDTEGTQTQQATGKGTYVVNTGDFANGTITITLTHNWTSSGWKAASNESSIVSVTSGSFTLEDKTYTKQ